MLPPPVVAADELNETPQMNLYANRKSKSPWYMFRLRPGMLRK